MTPLPAHTRLLVARLREHARRETDWPAESLLLEAANAIEHAAPAHGAPADGVGRAGEGGRVSNDPAADLPPLYQRERQWLISHCHLSPIAADALTAEKIVFMASFVRARIRNAI
jgi:hypothetical protein